MQTASTFGASSNFLSLYIRSSMNIFSREQKCNCSSNSPFLISSSRRMSAMVRSTECRNTSLTVRNFGLLSSITQQFGLMLTSQSENAYSASSVLSLDTPGARCTNISTSAAVLSSTLRAFIFPFSIALRIDSISVVVFLPNGISRITRVLLSSFSIFARTLSCPPRCPSLYLDTSMLPPVMKSGYSWKSSPCR